MAIFQIDADRVITDTFSYVRVAEADLRESAFWLGERPPAIPLLYKALGLNSATVSDPFHLQRVTVFQLLLASIAWGVLAGVVAWVSESRPQRTVAVLLILGFGLTLDIAYWDRILLSESVSTSLFALLVAGLILGIRFWGDPQQPIRPIGKFAYLMGMTALTVLFAFTRDVNAYMLDAASLLLLVTIVVKGARGRPVHWDLVVLSLVMALTALFHNHTNAVSKRWLGPLLNVFSARILPVNNFVSFFEARGMPADAITDEMYLGRSVFLSQLERTRDGRRLKEWLEQYGRSTYLQFLVSRPLRTLGRPLRDLPELVSPDSSEYRLPQHPDPGWALALREVLFPKRLQFVGMLILIPAIALGLARRGARFASSGSAMKAILLPAIGLLVLAYPIALVVWHGDAVELERHSHNLAVQVRLAGWLLVIAALHSK